MSPLRRIASAPLAVALLLCAQTVVASDCYPCGPENLPPAIKRMIPQEFHGADFRPACRRHDRCYGAPGANKCACDLRFLKDLNSACNCSEHPVACRAVSCLYFVSVKVGGRNAFNRAQGH
ncbi:MAG: hypothetical protein KDA37_08340 [Planctomycetales bacterium]|nr:hypothetical protein [Planctomycetales bacterium]